MSVVETGRSARAVARPFVDTNVLLYLISAEAAKAATAEALLRQGITIGVQVLNEFANVAHRRHGLPWAEVADMLSLIRKRSTVHPLTTQIHEAGLRLAARYRMSWYDALIVAAAADAHCRLLLSEDMQDGQRIDATLTIRNPFVALLP